MMKSKLSIALTAILASSTTLFAQGVASSAGILVKFQGGIGVDPVSNVNVNVTTGVTVVKNIVRGVNPAGQIWVIADLKATVKVDGRITVDGRGLVFGGGNTVGISLAPPATPFNVFATLICETAAPFTQFSTNAVPLAADGDFRIDDVLSPLPPSSCASPVLLIREAVGQTWFAAGIPKIGN